MSVTDADGFGVSDIAAALPVSRETLERLTALVDQFDAWTPKLNLIGPRERDQIWRRHIFDSLQLLPHLPEGAKVLDFGSGGGFPALPLACALAESRDCEVIMVESIAKKCAFLRAVVGDLALPARVIHGRVESIEENVGVGIVTARAVAPLTKLLDYASPWLCNGATALFHKGENWEEELTQARTRWTFASEAIPSLSGGYGVILKLSEVRRERT